MGSLYYTTCISCGRSGHAREDTNYIFECWKCEKRRTDKEIKRSTQQSLWVRFLYWILK